MGSAANKSISDADCIDVVLLDEDDELLKNGLTEAGFVPTLDWEETNQVRHFSTEVIGQTLNWFMAASSSART